MSNRFTQETIHKVLKQIYPGIDLTPNLQDKYVQVKCPFPTHPDHTPSAGINPDDGYFKCFSCNGAKEYQFDEFLKEYYKYSDRRKWVKILDYLEANTDEDINLDKGTQELLNPTTLHAQSAKLQLNLLGISDLVIKECKLQYNADSPYILKLPVLNSGVLFGFKYYSPKPPQDKPKAYGSIPNGMPIPFDVWKNDTRPTLICEGEKDMLVARSNGFNAICWGGGAKTLPLGWEKSFEGKEIIIAYDNDDAGKEGSAKLADWFLEHKITNVKVLTNFHEVLDKKEDITDFFVKYKKTQWDLQQYINQTGIWTLGQSQALGYRKPPVPLWQARNPQNRNKKLCSLVTVLTELDEPYAIDTAWDYELVPSRKDSVAPPFKSTLYIEEHNMEYVFGLIEARSVKEKYLEEIILRDARYKGLEGPWKVNYKKPVPGANETLYVAQVGPYTESEIQSDKLTAEEAKRLNTELTVYSFQPLFAGDVLEIEYVPIAQEFDTATLVGLVHEIRDAPNSVERYEITEQTKKSLDKFKSNLPIKEQVNILYRQMLSSIPFLDKMMWLAVDLTFHSPLWFRYGGKIKRGVVYTNIVGDTRTGKSTLAQDLVQLYKQGKFLNAKQATVTGLVGGSDKVNGEWALKLGALPRNNGGISILEEIQGLGAEFFGKVTEIKSSNKVTLIRASGQLEAPCALRLIEISNPVSEGSSLTMSEFANGMGWISNLVGKDEDIARDDIYVPVVASKAVYTGDRHPDALDMYNNIDYQERIKWAWTRSVNDVEMSKDTELYIFKKAQELNAVFECPGACLFNRESDIRLARLSISLAILLCSTYDYKKVEVTREHVDFICEYLTKLYSSELMGLDKYAQDIRSYHDEVPGDLENLQAIYKEFPAVVDMLETQSNKVPREVVIQFANKPANEAFKVLNMLTVSKFISLEQNKVRVTAKFRKVVKKLNKKLDLMGTASSINF